MRTPVFLASVALAACGGHANRPTEPMDKQLTSMMTSMEMPMDDGATSSGPTTRATSR